MNIDHDHMGRDGSVDKLVKLIDYHADAVVSKVLLKTEAGSVTLFAFGADQELSEHTAPFEALVYAVDGSADVGIAAVRHRLRAGELLRLPANVPHWVRAVGAFKMLLIMLRDA